MIKLLEIFKSAERRSMPIPESIFCPNYLPIAKSITDSSWSDLPSDSSKQFLNSSKSSTESQVQIYHSNSNWPPKEEELKQIIYELQQTSTVKSLPVAIAFLDKKSIG